MPKSTGHNRKRTRRIFPTVTTRGGAALALIVADKKAKGEPHAHLSGAIEDAVVAECQRRGLPLPPESESPTHDDA